MTEESEITAPPRWPRRLALAIVAGLVVAALLYAFIPRRSDESYEQECRELADAEQWDRLKDLAAEWSDTTENPDHALIYLAEGQLQSGDPMRAVETLLSVPIRSSKSYAALVTACNLQFGPLNRPLDGVETLKIMAQQNPGSAGTRMRLIFFYAVTLQRREMLDAIYDAIAHRAEPSDAYAYLLIADRLALTNGFAKSSEWLKSDPDSELLKAARMVHLMQNVGAAENPALQEKMGEYVKSFEKLRDEYPHNVPLLCHALERAIEAYDVEAVERLVADIPSGTRDSVILRQMAWLKSEHGEFEEARDLLEQSLSEHLVDWHTWHDLAACRRRLGDAEGAAEASENAITGKALRKAVMQLDGTSDLSPDLLNRIAKYAENCGDWRVNTAILQRLAAMSRNQAF